MQPSTKKVTISNIFRNRRGTIVYRGLIAAFGIALKVFFRRIETVNADTVPRGTGVIFVMNHPNGLIDPALVFVALPRRISFLAKSTLFRMPVIGWILRTVGALPLYRKIDAGEDVSKNLKTFEMCHDLLRDGGSIALFPEGVSHNSPKMLPLKSGASRIALGAASAGDGEITVKIVPVGLYYTNKTTFRSEALLHFGEAFDVPSVTLDETGQPPRDDVKALTEQIDSALRQVTLNAETESELFAARIAEQIFSSAESEQSLAGELEFQKEFIRDAADGNDSDGEAKLEVRLTAFDASLDDVGLEPQHLSLAQYSQWSVVRSAFNYAWRLILLTPLAIVGVVLHAPAYQLCRLFANWYANHGADDVASTVKVLAGMLFMPMTWLIATATAFYFWRSPWVLLVIPIGFISGYAALYTLEEIEEMRGWAKAIWLFLTRRERFLRLYVERRNIQQHLQDSQ